MYDSKDVSILITGLKNLLKGRDSWTSGHKGPSQLLDRSSA